MCSGEEEPKRHGQDLEDDSVSMEPGKGGPTPQQLNKMMHQALHTVNQLLVDLEKDKGERGDIGWSSLGLGMCSGEHPKATVATGAGGRCKSSLILAADFSHLGPALTFDYGCSTGADRAEVQMCAVVR